MGAAGSWPSLPVQMMQHSLPCPWFLYPLNSALCGPFFSPTVWCALDDMCADNGCLVVWPGSHGPEAPPLAEQQQGAALWEATERQNEPACVQSATGRHRQQQQQQQRPRLQQEGQQQQHQPSCSHGGCVPFALEVPAGTVVITSDTVLHASGPNCTQHFRRAWMPQFSASELSWVGSGLPVSLAIPLRPSADVSSPP